MHAQRPFSYKWMIISMTVFIGIELVLGGIVGELIVGRYLSHSLRFLLQGVLNLASYFLGGLLIGVISPGLRIHEPAAGAFLSVALMLALSLFTPYSFIQFSLTKMLIGGAVALVLALAGAELGERLTGNRVA
ncbi:MAG: hypothetical protein ACE5G0_06800 [Rhodothermales bacterium]